jgi:hypothetical protein
MKFLIENNEEEVGLRLQFESKLNSLHALHRDLAAKYDRSTEEIYELEKQGKYDKDLIGVQKEELIQLRAIKIDQETQISYLQEKLK